MRATESEYGESERESEWGVLIVKYLGRVRGTGGEVRRESKRE